MELLPTITTRQLQQQIDFLKKNLHAITKAKKTNITDSAKKCGKLANHKLYDCLFKFKQIQQIVIKSKNNLVRNQGLTAVAIGQQFGMKPNDEMSEMILVWLNFDFVTILQYLNQIQEQMSKLFQNLMKL